MIYKNSKGYTLLFAVIVASVTLAIGVSILTISKKEFLLSSAARESSISFYAADAGFECAMYQDGQGLFTQANYQRDWDCGMGHGNITASKNSNNEDVYTFHAHFSTGLACAIVEVTKQNNAPKTIVDSKGYNLAWDGSGSCTKTSPKMTERLLHAEF